MFTTSFCDGNVPIELEIHVYNTSVFPELKNKKSLENK